MLQQEVLEYLAEFPNVCDAPTFVYKAISNWTNLHVNPSAVGQAAKSQFKCISHTILLCDAGTC